MAYHYLRRAAVFAALLQSTTAQRASVIPQDLSAGFSSGDEVQVSYTGEAVNGFRSGTTFEKDAVSKEPEFALGDSNGISPTILQTMVMVDTTCPKARKLHYVRSNFKFDFQGGTNIVTESAPLLDYKAPGAFGEKGDNRQYTFLMYLNPDRKEITNLKLPAEGENFDIAKFEKDNGLKPATAGVGMVVKLGGQADCEGGDANPAPPAPPAQSSASPAPSSAAAPSSSATSRSTASPSSAAASRTTASPSSAAASPSSAATSSSVVAPSSAAASNSVSATSPVRSSAGAGASPSSGGSQQAGASTSRAATAVPTTGASLPTGASRSPVSSAGIVTSVQSGGAVATGSGTASAAPAEQTTNAAAGQLFTQGMVMVPFLAMVGALAL